MSTRRPDSNRGGTGGQSGLGILLLLAGVAIGLLILAYAFDDNSSTNVSTGSTTTVKTTPTTTTIKTGSTTPGQTTTAPPPPASTLAPGAIKVQVVNAA